MNTLKNLLADPKVRAALVALVLAVAGYFGFGCSSVQLAPALEKGVAVADCQLEAVRALVPHAQTADAVVAAARIGDVQRAVALLLALGLQPEDIQAVALAFDACMPAEPLPLSPNPDAAVNL
jgi:hypothetical protein